MNNYIQYFTEVTMALGLFYMIYHLLLRNEADHVFNRFYLLIAFLASHVLPLLSINNPWSSSGIIGVNSLSEFVTSQGNIQNETVPLVNPMWLFYIAGTLLVAGKLLKQLLVIHQMKRNSQTSEYKGYKVYQLDGKGATFSFWNSIFMDRESQNLPEYDKQRVLEHEYIHVKEGHSLDLILMEIIHVIFWFNPLIFLYKNALKNTHEYLADRQVVKTTEQRAYINLLVQQALSNIGLSLGHHFGVQLNKPYGSNKSKTLKRIEMMKKHNQRMKGFKYIIPVVMFMMVFVIVSCEPGAADAQVPESSSEAMSVVENMPEYPGGNDALISKLASEIRYPELSKKAGVEGKCFVQFVVATDGSIQKVKAIKTDISGSEDLNFAKAFEDESIRVVSNLENWTPGSNEGKLVNTKLVLPIVFKL